MVHRAMEGVAYLIDIVKISRGLKFVQGVRWIAWEPDRPYCADPGQMSRCVYPKRWGYLRPFR
jgi:hypothetical protein